MSKQEIQGLTDGLRSVHADVASSISGITEDEAHTVPAPDEWTVAQLLAHIAEIQSFWMGKAILITQEHDPNITRTEVENDIRSAAVDDHSSDSLEELTASLARANEAAITSVENIDPKDLGRPGHRGEGNPITVKGVVQYLTEHIAEHARQITESRRLIRELQ